MGNFEFCATSTVERAKVACNRSVRRPTGAALQFRAAPNHSRPASCISDADIDAEDYPEQDPQKGQ